MCLASKTSPPLKGILLLKFITIDWLSLLWTLYKWNNLECIILYLAFFPTQYYLWVHVISVICSFFKMLSCIPFIPFIVDEHFDCFHFGAILWMKWQWTFLYISFHGHIWHIPLWFWFAYLWWLMIIVLVNYDWLINWKLPVVYNNKYLLVMIFWVRWVSSTLSILSSFLLDPVG